MVKRNGFFMLMMERRPQLEAEGFKFPRGWADVANAVGDEWQKKQPAEKEKYQEKADRYNARAGQGNQRNRRPTPTPPQPPSRPEQIELPHSIQLEMTSTVPPSKRDMGEAALLELEYRNRKLVCDMFNRDDWKDTAIVVCSFTMFLTMEENGTFSPAEVGLAAFSLKRGLFDNFGRLILPDPKLVPLGWGVELLAKAIKYSIPEIGHTTAFSDLESLSQTVEAFLIRHRTNICPYKKQEYFVFALGSEIEQVTSSLDWLMRASGYSFVVHVLNLSLWAQMASCGKFHELRKTADLPVAEKDRNQLSIDVEMLEEAMSTKRPVSEPLCRTFVYPSYIPYIRQGLFAAESDVDDLVNATENYRFYDELCCVYHYKKGEGIQYCALLGANRLVYMLLEVLTRSNEVKILAGAHYPEVDVPLREWTRRYKMIKQWGTTHFEEEMENPPVQSAVAVDAPVSSRGNPRRSGQRGGGTEIFFRGRNSQRHHDSPGGGRQDVRESTVDKDASQSEPFAQTCRGGSPRARSTGRQEKEEEQLEGIPNPYKGKPPAMFNRY